MKTLLLFALILSCRLYSQDSHLKKWCDSSEIIIDCDLLEDNLAWVDTGGLNPKTGFNYGYYSAKVKINRVIKGKLNKGYININPNYPNSSAPVILVDGARRDNDKFILTGRNIMRIKKSKITKEGFTVENKGVYESVGTVYHLDIPSNEVRVRKVNGKDVFYNTTGEFYDKLVSCGCTKLE